MLVKLYVLAAVIGCISEVVPATGADTDLVPYELVDPKTGEPLPPDGYSLNSVGGGTSFRAPDCNCGKYFCNCCVGMKIRGQVENVCGRVDVEIRSVGVHGSLIVNNRAVWSKEISINNPPSICYGITGTVKACLRLYDLHKYGKNFHGCMQLSMKVSRITVLKANAGCMDIGENGVHYSRSARRSLSKMSLSSLSDSDYDQVDFEEVHNDNDEHSNESDDDDKIGQLKSY